MWTLLIAMLVILVVAGLVVVYVAFPHRGEEVPAAPWLGDAMRSAVEAAPTLEHPEGESTEESARLPGQQQSQQQGEQQGGQRRA